MRPQRRAQQIIGRPDVGHPIAHRLADGVFQRLRPRADPADLSAQQPHAQHIQLLALHVHIAHVDNALHAQQRAHCSRSHPMLPRAGFGDDALLAHPLGQQPLAQRVVDLVRPRVQQVFALQVDLGAAQLLRQPLGKVKRRRPPRIILQQIGQLRLKRRVRLGHIVLMLQFEQRRHQRLRHIPPAIHAKPPRPRLRVIRMPCWNNDRCHGASSTLAQEMGNFPVYKVPILRSV